MKRVNVLTPKMECEILGEVDGDDVNIDAYMEGEDVSLAFKILIESIIMKMSKQPDVFLDEEDGNINIITSLWCLGREIKWTISLSDAIKESLRSEHLISKKSLLEHIERVENS